MPGEEEAKLFPVQTPQKPILNHKICLFTFIILYWKKLIWPCRQNKIKEDNKLTTLLFVYITFWTKTNSTLKSK